MIIQSPLNYTGGKYKLLPQLLPIFPKKIRHFFDFFCGGCNVGVNVESEKTIFVDNDEHLMYLYQTFRNVNKDDIFSWIYEIISKYDLSDASRNGYEYYGCNGSVGLGEYNRERFARLRSDFNAQRLVDYRHYVMMYVIVVYAFNNQIRFNSKGEFNLPVGKRDFNSRMQKKLANFIDRIQNDKFSFIRSDFREFRAADFAPDDFVYADPPYLITRATYNENDGWNENDERDLLYFLDSLHSQGIRFALSNVLSSKDNENRVLISWLGKNPEKYKTIHLKNSYANSNYHRLHKDSFSDEVVIVNY